MFKTKKNKRQQKSALKENAIHWIWNAAAGVRKAMIVLLILQITINIGSVCYSLLFRELIDQAVDRHLSGFYYALAVLAGLAIIQMLLRAVFRWLEEYARAKMENALKGRLFTALLGKEYASVMATHTGEWMNRLTSDTVIVADGSIQIVPYVGGMIVKMVGAFCSITLLVPHFGLLIVVAGLMILCAVRYMRPLLKRLHKKIQETDGQTRVFLQERLDNLLIVKAFSQKSRSAAIAEEKMEMHRRARMKRNHISNAYAVGFAFAIQAIYLLGAFICGMGIVRETLSYGTMVAVLQLIGQLQTPLSGLNSYVTKWYAMLASAERLMEAESFQEDHADEALTDREIMDFYSREFSGIRLEHLQFTYTDPTSENGAPITIRDLNMDLRKGEFVSIVGRSGSGKSTLLKLLMCLYEPDSGNRWLLKRQPEEKSALTIRESRLFAYVPQGNQLMSGTIREILTFNDPNAYQQESQLWEALKVACADEFILQLPQGLDTVLGEHGSGLSEGQLQRLALARAVYSQRPILLLDESTSALDAETEEKVLHNLRTMTNRTVLIVTHRPQANRICDRVIRIENMETEKRTDTAMALE